MIQVGFGQDSHLIKPKTQESSKISRLGTIELKDLEIIAHSDGDVIIHALCNALSSAIGGDSLGTWADAMFEKGVTDSREFLKIVLSKVKEKGFKVNNISIGLEAQSPRLNKEEIHQIRSNLAGILKITPETVGITFTSGETITPFGQGKAIQCFAVVSIIKDDN